MGLPGRADRASSVTTRYLIEKVSEDVGGRVPRDNGADNGAAALGRVTSGVIYWISPQWAKAV